VNPKPRSAETGRRFFLPFHKGLSASIISRRQCLAPQIRLAQKGRPNRGFFHHAFLELVHEDKKFARLFLLPALMPINGRGFKREGVQRIQKPGGVKDRRTRKRLRNNESQPLQSSGFFKDKQISKKGYPERNYGEADAAGRGGYCRDKGTSKLGVCNQKFY
jgi:hypothetical protein